DEVPNYAAGVQGSGIPADTTPPGDVTGFTVTPGDTQNGLSWTNPGDSDLAGVKIMFKTTGYPSGPADGTECYSGLGTSTTHTSLTNGTPYYYKAFSFDEVPNYSSGSQGSGTPADTTPPGDVTGFVVTPGDTQNSLSWTNPGGDFTGTRIMFKTTGSPTSATDGTQVYDGAGTSTTHTSLTNGTTYYYKAYAHDEVPNYAAGVQGSGIPADVTPPGDVTGFVVTPGDTQNSLSWTNPGGDFTGTKIMFKTTGYPTGATDGTQVYDGAGTSTNHTSLTNGTTYYYKAYAHDEVPNYAAGVQGSGAPADTTAPGPVTGFTATPGNTQVSLSWTNPGGDFLGTKVLFKTTGYPANPTDGTTINDSSGASTVHTGLTNGVTYYYCAFAHDEVPNYAAAAQASAIPTGGPITVTVQRGTYGTVKDVYIRTSNPEEPGVDENINFGNPFDPQALRLYADVGYGAKGPRHMLVWFDLSFIPAGATINWATFGEYYWLGAGRPDITGLKLSRLQPGATWVEGGGDLLPTVNPWPTWNQREYGATNWGTAGATGAADKDDSTTKTYDLTGGTDGFRTVDVASFVNGWVNGGWTNNGMLMWGGNDPANGATYWFESCSEDATVANRPYLTVNYTSGDTTPPGDVAGFAATPGGLQNSLSWTNPTDPDFAGVKIMFKTTGYPTGPTDGTQCYSGTGTSTIHSGLSAGVTYYYAAYAFDEVPNYASGATASGVPTAVTLNNSTFNSNADGWTTSTWRAGTAGYGTMAWNSAAGSPGGGMRSTGAATANNSDRCQREGGIITKTISTVGYSNIKVTYDLDVNSLGTAYTGAGTGTCTVDHNLIDEQITVFYTTNGSTWTEAEYLLRSSLLASYQAWGARTINLTGVPACNNNPNFGLRFRWQFNTTSDQGNLDDIVVTAN
ncbi:MAG: DNRLRE domain-containing protein, partial [Armatimonadota bacterium]|nr:DNRLRE domain-containing protein [Armatimonadota bacterium]